MRLRLIASALLALLLALGGMPSGGGAAGFGPAPAQAAVNLPGLSNDAADYLRRIERQAPAQRNARTRDTALTRARDAAQANNWPAAIAAYEEAIAHGAGTIDTWLALSEAWQRRDPPDHARALQAAWNGYQSVPSGPPEIPALLRMADVLEQGMARPAQALEALQEVLRLNRNHAQARQRVAAIRQAMGLLVNRIRTDAEASPPRACLAFSEPLSDRPEIRYEDFIRLEPRAEIAVRVEEGQLCITGLAFGRQYRLTLRQGLPSASPTRMTADRTVTLRIPDRAPRVLFRSNGFILPRGQDRAVPITTMNVAEVEVRVARIGERNIVNQIQRNGIGREVYGYQTREMVERSGRAVWEGRLRVPNPAQNEQVETALPLDEVLRNAGPGIFMILARNADNSSSRAAAEEWYYEDLATQWVVLTDIGLTAVRGADGLTVLARSIETAEPLANHEVALMARDNEELARARTDAMGVVRFPIALMRGRGGAAPIAVTAFGAGGDFAFLDLSAAAFDLSDRGIEGRTPPGPLDAFLYTDRGIYRPGETVNLMALLRDDAVRAVENVPLTLRVRRPNRTVFFQQVIERQPAASFHLPLRLTDTAPLGQWIVEALADPNAPPVGIASFQVEEFVPEKLKVEITPPDRPLVAGQTLPLEVTARFLYGPPGVGLTGSGEMTLGVDPLPFPAFAGYQFGLVQERFPGRQIELEVPATNEQGRTAIPLSLEQAPDTTHPLRAVINIGIAEPGGRATRASITIPVRPTELAIGIRPGFQGRNVDRNQDAAFEIIALNPAGQRIAAPDLRLRLVREVYEWRIVRHNEAWRYEAQWRDVPVATEALAVPADRPASFARRLDFGRYRIEVVDPSGVSASSVRFYSGWSWNPPGSQTPDMAEVTADRRSYRAGETARISVRAPFAGLATIFVATDRVWSVQTLALPADGASVDVPVSADWGPGAYVGVAVHRPRAGLREAEPVRAIGFAWLGVDPAARTLAVAIEQPQLVRPRTRVEIPVSVAGGGLDTYVTLAAVDEGILQITNFQTPDPAGYYLGKRALGLDLRDDYGRLIDPASGPRGVLRQGGDEGSLGRALPAIPIRLVSLFVPPTRLDAQGRARIALDIPDFQGELRIMVVAYDATRVGRAAAPLTVRDPVVADLILPRFLAPGDEARATINLHNVDGPPGPVRLRFATEGPLALGTAPELTETLAANERRTLALPLRGTGDGIARVALTVEAPGGFRAVRDWQITVRSSRPAITVATSRQLQPNETLGVDPAVAARFVPGSAAVSLVFGGRLRYDRGALMRSLATYAYGCVEQVTSQAFPLVFLDDETLAFGGRTPPSGGRQSAIEAAARSIADRQRFDGGFGLWSASSPADPWISAYATEFLLRARAAGAFVPEATLREALRYHADEAGNRGSRPEELAAGAYQLYVLALADQPRPGAMRFIADGFAEQLPTPLAKAQLGAAFARIGDRARAEALFASALGAMQRRYWSADYGSTIRDAAAILVLTEEAGLMRDRTAPIVDLLAPSGITAAYTSTQEQAWLVAASAALGRDERPITLASGTTMIGPRAMITLAPNPRQIAAGYSVRNAGAEPVWHSLSVSGVPAEPAPATREGLRIRRSFHRNDGSPLDLDAVRQNDSFIILLEAWAETGDGHQMLLVQSLPGGWEIERVFASGQTAGMPWLGSLDEPAAAEARDDRFAAQIDTTRGSRPVRLAFRARAVTQGQFELPGASAEDMYRPRFHARQAAGRITVGAAAN
ncbi:MAG: alpha-2-macroglobulin family protein [Alphaproteobacteria bacterium]|nr:alpha-2-macroglobulin family protein [Alphaproteobacteria bacterium]